MSRSNRDIGGYRGRRTVTDILRLIAIVLGVLVVLAVVGVFFLQRYVVYTPEGARLELPPFLQVLRQEGKEPAGGSASLPDPGELNIDVQPAGSQSEPQTEPEIPPYGLELSVDEVVNGTAAARLSEAGAEMLVLEVKDGEGQLAWLSATPEAEKSKVNGTQARTDALRSWNAQGVYTVARVCCFRDNSAAYHVNSQALHQSNGTWRDELGLRWLSPAQDQAQAYIAALCGELAELGFDEILLEQFSFPASGKVERILRGTAYDPSRLGQEMEQFLAQVRQAVEPYGTKVSLRLERDVLENMDLSGLSPSLLNGGADRLWSGGEAYQLLLDMPELENLEERTVEIVSQAEEDRSLCQAVLAPEE